MYQDEIYQKALEERKEESLKELKHEVKTVERLIEKFLTQILESSAFLAERDFPACVA